jgi:phage repressor protein C with HTH and peptisase S24 domain
MSGETCIVERDFQLRRESQLAIIRVRVKGNSMSPLILDGYIIAVDTSEVRHDCLTGQIVVARHHEKGLLVSRLIRFDHTDALVSAVRHPFGWRLTKSV